MQQNGKRAIYVPQVEKYEAPRLGQVVTLNVGFMERLPLLYVMSHDQT